MIDIKKLYFSNLSSHIQKGMEELAAELGFVLEPGGITISVSVQENAGQITVHRDGNIAEVTVAREHQVFRAATHLLQKEETSYTYTEPVMFDTFGMMLDGSQANSLLNLTACKRMLRLAAGMGYNMFMLYLEDCYDVEGEPYFGYMRPRYTQEELKTLDDYAWQLGIEMIPCIQTLGHLTDALKRSYPYGSCREDQHTLLVGEERTYELIENLLRAASAPFRSKRINIGMDEAWILGRGKYLSLHGYREKSDIMKEHVMRVWKITQKLGLQPIMWGDMFFRAHSAGNEYISKNVVLPDSVRDEVPPGVIPVYWDYDNNRETYLHMIGEFKKLSEDFFYAGAASATQSYAPHHAMTVRSLSQAMPACKETGVRNAFVTVWGDNQREASVFVTLAGLQLFAEHGYTTGVPSHEYCAARFRACTGVEMSAFMDFNALDEVPGYHDPNLDPVSSLSRALMWQDVLLGILDKDLRNFDFSGHYRTLAEHFTVYAEEYPKYADLFQLNQNVAAVLEIKGNIGIQLADAYTRRDNRLLEQLTWENLSELRRRMEKLRRSHRSYFLAHHKPLGWEILDIRYGGALARLDTAVQRLEDYLGGKIAQIEELEEPRLSFTGQNKLPPGLHLKYGHLCSASRL